MPTPDELQQLSDEIRRAGAMLVQVAMTAILKS